MCCYKDDNIEQRVKDKATYGPITCFKVLDLIRHGDTRDKAKICSVSFDVDPVYIWKIGVNKAKFDGVTETPFVYNVHNPRGIHVFLTRKYAENFLNNIAIACPQPHIKHILLPVTCNVNDLIIAGFSSYLCVKGSKEEAVFTQVTVTQKEWDKNVKPHLSAEKVI